MVPSASFEHLKQNLANSYQKIIPFTFFGMTVKTLAKTKNSNCRQQLFFRHFAANLFIFRPFSFGHVKAVESLGSV